MFGKFAQRVGRRRDEEAGQDLTGAETIESFEMLSRGDLDDVPEQAFFNVGNVESVLAKQRDLEKNA